MVLVEISSEKKVVYATLLTTFVSPGLLRLVNPRMYMYLDPSSSWFRPRVNISWFATKMSIHPGQRTINLPRVIKMPFATGGLIRMLLADPAVKLSLLAGVQSKFTYIPVVPPQGTDSIGTGLLPQSMPNSPPPTEEAET